MSRRLPWRTLAPARNPARHSFHHEAHAAAPAIAAGRQISESGGERLVCHAFHAECVWRSCVRHSPSTAARCQMSDVRAIFQLIPLLADSQKQAVECADRHVVVVVSRSHTGRNPALDQILQPRAEVVTPPADSAFPVCRLRGDSRAKRTRFGELIGVENRPTVAALGLMSYSDNCKSYRTIANTSLGDYT
jgi:hypothetical protein